MTEKTNYLDSYSVFDGILKTIYPFHVIIFIIALYLIGYNSLRIFKIESNRYTSQLAEKNNSLFDQKINKLQLECIKIKEQNESLLEELADLKQRMQKIEYEKK